MGINVHLQYCYLIIDYYISLAIKPTADIAVNTTLSDNSFIQMGENSFLVRAGNEFGIDCITGSHFNATWYYGSVSVKG